MSKLPTTAGPHRALGVAAGLGVLAAAVVLERLRTYAEPLERDVAGYAVIGHEMLRGRNLYTDLWERKPPLLYATFAAAERVVGYGPGEVFVVNVGAALVTLAGCYAAGRAGSGSTVGGLVAAAMWALVCGDPWLLANQPNGEVFVNAALTPAVALLLGRRAERWTTGLSVGGLFTLATLYEQHVLVTCATLAVGYVAAGGRARVGRRAALMSVAAGVGAAAWAGLAGYLGRRRPTLGGHRRPVPPTVQQTSACRPTSPARSSRSTSSRSCWRGR